MVPTVKHEFELALGKMMLQFQETVERTLVGLTPSTLCEYIYELCKLASRLLKECKVLGSPEQNQRLLLVLSLPRLGNYVV